MLAAAPWCLVQSRRLDIGESQALAAKDMQLQRQQQAEHEHLRQLQQLQHQVGRLEEQIEQQQQQQEGRASAKGPWELASDEAAAAVQDRSRLQEDLTDARRDLQEALDSRGRLMLQLEVMASELAKRTDEKRQLEDLLHEYAQRSAEQIESLRRQQAPAGKANASVSGARRR